MPLSRTLARPLLSSMFVVGGANTLANQEAMAERSAPVTERIGAVVRDTVPAASRFVTPENLVRANAAIHLGAGLALATGRAPRLSSAVLAATLVPTTLGGHRFWEETDPMARNNQRIHFFKNLSVFGGLVLASLDTEGRPGLRWRARRAVHDVSKDVSRETRHLRRLAAQQAKIAASALPGT
jgi:uncharacterized membrane protein YphA (DoxX/SURF4 family)